MKCKEVDRHYEKITELLMAKSQPFTKTHFTVFSESIAPSSLYVPFPQYFQVPSLSACRGSDLLQQHKRLPPNKVREK